MAIVLFEKLPDTCGPEALDRNEVASRRLQYLAQNTRFKKFLPVWYQSGKMGEQVDLVGPRNLPRIRDLMDYAVETLGCTDRLVGIMNSDLVLSFTGMKALAESKADIVLLSRNDVDAGVLEDAVDDEGMLQDTFKSKAVNSGISADGWFMKPRAWEVLREYYPKEMLIGEPWWDTCAIHLSKAFCRVLQVESLTDKHAYHPLHRGAWVDISEEALKARAAWYNLKVLIRIGEVGGSNV